MSIQRMEIERLVRNAELAAKPLPTIDPDEVKGGAAQVARLVRAAWDVPRGPIKNLTALVEDAGVIIVHFDFGTQKLDGVSVWGDRGKIPIVFLNRGFPSGRMRLTLAHELGHLVMHRTPKASMEDEAYEFAAEFLMPEAEIVSSFYPVGLDELARLKVHWRVSMQALLKRAESLGVMTPRYSRYLWMLMGKHGYRTREPHDELIPRESPGLVRELVQLHTGELGYSPAELARVLAATEEDFQERYQSGDSPVTILR